MYQIFIKKRAKKFIDKLPVTEKRRIIEAIEKLPAGEDIKEAKRIRRSTALESGFISYYL